MTKPTIGLLLGDPTGIGPEIVAKLLASTDVCQPANLVLIGDRRLLQMGARVADVELDIPVIHSPEEIAGSAYPVLLDVPSLAPEDVTPGRVSAAAGKAVMETRSVALDLVKQGLVHGLVTAPTNKEAIMRAGYPLGGVIGTLAVELGWDGPRGELNVLDDLWTSRVTSHVPMAQVSQLLTKEKVLLAVELIHRELAASGAKPKIAVAAYNPHAGEGGLVGREELDVLGPAVAEAQARGMDAQGPFPADTVFPMAMERGYNAVVTMYHDQGQIAMKLLGFHRGVTVSGGLPVPMTTPAHGTAHDIAGQGVADPSALEGAYRLAAKMAGAQTSG